jgi:hypothetical protein
VSRTVNCSLKLPLKANLCLFMIRFTAIDAKFAPPQYVPIQKERPSYSRKATASSKFK